jgi:Polyketide cyclase / dehydrase and lipid transport
MARVSVAEVFPASVHEAETCWYDVARWSSWVDGLERVTDVTGSWPAAGARVVWQSGPAGRGRVVERAVSHERLRGQAVDVDDDSIRGRQTVTFTPHADGVEVALSLDYELKRRWLLTPLVDLLFIRRAIETSLRKSVARFGVELTETRKSGRTLDSGDAPRSRGE